jgi:hypothetical protein
VGFWVTYIVEAGGHHVLAMAQAEELGIRACLTRSTIDTSFELPATLAIETIEYSLQVKHDNTN